MEQVPVSGRAVLGDVLVDRLADVVPQRDVAGRRAGAVVPYVDPQFRRPVMKREHHGVLRVRLYGSDGIADQLGRDRLRIIRQLGHPPAGEGVACVATGRCR